MTTLGRVILVFSSDDAEEERRDGKKDLIRLNVPQVFTSNVRIIVSLSMTSSVSVLATLRVPSFSRDTIDGTRPRMPAQ